MLNKIEDKSITYNILRIQPNNFIMCGFYCLAFMEYMTAEKIVLDSPTYLLPTIIKRVTDNIPVL